MRWLPLLLLTLTACNPGGKDTQPNYAIAYNIAVKDSTGESNYEVFTMDMAGNGSKNISNSDDVAWTYNAYKDRLFLVSDRDTCYRCYFLFETNFNGDKLRKVSDLRLEDSWMDARNDGKELIVSGRIGKEIRYQLFLMDTETGSYRQLTSDTAAMYNDPAFSPDGSQIAFIYRKNRRDRTQNEEVYTMNIDGTGMRQLTNYPQENISRESNGYKAGCTHWHPTGNFITYISMQDGRHNIFAINPDGTQQRKLTGNNFAEGWHDWSSDGSWLVFDSSNEDESQYHIMLMNWDTKVVKQLTDTVYQYQQSPVFVEKLSQ